MRLLLVFILACVFLNGCASREDCIASAKDDYRGVLKDCKRDGLTYDECNESTEMEKDFLEKQRRCR
jgi:uncharacterized protein YceK